MSKGDRFWNFLAFPLLLPGYLHVIALSARERFRHARRPRLGDPALRLNCCGPLASDYPVGMEVKSIPELAAKLERVSSTNLNYTHWYACRICGQEWRENYESRGHADYPHVTKANE